MQSRMLSRPREEHHQAVDAQGDAAVRRGAELQGVQQEAESLAGRRGVDAQQPKHLLLKLLVVDTDRAAAGLVAVDHQVVGLRPGIAADRWPAARGLAAGAR